MKAVAVKELKNRLSSYLQEARNREVVLVTDLRAEGVLVAGLPQDPRVYRSSPLARVVRSDDLLAAERGER